MKASLLRGSMLTLFIYGTLCIICGAARAQQQPSPQATPLLGYRTTPTPLPTPSPLAHQTMVSLVSSHVIADHIVENGSGQTFTVKWISPILYDRPYIQDSKSTIVSALPSLSNVPTPTGLGSTVKGLVSTPPPVPIVCATVLPCVRAINKLDLTQKALTDDFATWNSYSLFAYQDITEAVAAYQSAATSAAPVSASPLNPADIPYEPCLEEVRETAKRNLGQSSNTLASTTSLCPGISKTPRTTLFEFFSEMSAFESTLVALRNQIDEHTAAFSSTTNPSVTTGLNDAATLKARLTGLDIAPLSIGGAAGAALFAQVQRLLPFFDYDPNLATASINILCDQHAMDGQSNALTLYAVSRITTTPALSQLVGTVDCPGALVLSLGAGYSSVPLNTFQVAPINPTSSPALGTIYETSQKRQLYAASLAHYLIYPFGNSQVGLFATAGVGTSTQSFSGFYGFSIGGGRRIFVNGLWEFAPFTQLGQGVSLGETVPVGFSIPTTTARTSKISLGISFALSSSGH